MGNKEDVQQHLESLGDALRRSPKNPEGDTREALSEAMKLARAELQEQQSDEKLARLVSKLEAVQARLEGLVEAGDDRMAAIPKIAPLEDAVRTFKSELHDLRLARIAAEAAQKQKPDVVASTADSESAKQEQANEEIDRILATITFTRLPADRVRIGDKIRGNNIVKKKVLDAFTDKAIELGWSKLTAKDWISARVDDVIAGMPIEGSEPVVAEPVVETVEQGPTVEPAPTQEPDEPRWKREQREKKVKIDGLIDGVLADDATGEAREAAVQQLIAMRDRRGLERLSMRVRHRENREKVGEELIDVIVEASHARSKEVFEGWVEKARQKRTSEARQGQIDKLANMALLDGTADEDIAALAIHEMWKMGANATLRSHVTNLAQRLLAAHAKESGPKDNRGRARENVVRWLENLKDLTALIDSGRVELEGEPEDILRVAGARRSVAADLESVADKYSKLIIASSGSTGQVSDGVLRVNIESDTARDDVAKMVEILKRSESGEEEKKDPEAEFMDLVVAGKVANEFKHHEVDADTLLGAYTDAQNVVDKANISLGAANEITKIILIDEGETRLAGKNAVYVNVTKQEWWDGLETVLKEAGERQVASTAQLEPAVAEGGRAELVADAGESSDTVSSAAEAERRVDATFRMHGERFGISREGILLGQEKTRLVYDMVYGPTRLEVDDSEPQWENHVRKFASAYEAEELAEAAALLHATQQKYAEQIRGVNIDVVYAAGGTGLSAAGRESRPLVQIDIAYSDWRSKVEAVIIPQMEVWVERRAQLEHVKKLRPGTRQRDRVSARDALIAMATLEGTEYALSAQRAIDLLVARLEGDEKATVLNSLYHTLRTNLGSGGNFPDVFNHLLDSHVLSIPDASFTDALTVLERLPKDYTNERAFVDHFIAEGDVEHLQQIQGVLEHKDAFTKDESLQKIDAALAAIADAAHEQATGVHDMRHIPEQPVFDLGGGGATFQPGEQFAGFGGEENTEPGVPAVVMPESFGAGLDDDGPVTERAPAVDVRSAAARAEAVPQDPDLCKELILNGSLERERRIEAWRSFRVHADRHQMAELFVEVWGPFGNSPDGESPGDIRFGIQSAHELKDQSYINTASDEELAYYAMGQVVAPVLREAKRAVDKLVERVQRKVSLLYLLKRGLPNGNFSDENVDEMDAHIAATLAGLEPAVVPSPLDRPPDYESDPGFSPLPFRPPRPRVSSSILPRRSASRRADSEPSPVREMYPTPSRKKGVGVGSLPKLNLLPIRQSEEKGWLSRMPRWAKGLGLALGISALGGGAYYGLSDREQPDARTTQEAKAAGDAPPKERFPGEFEDPIHIPEVREEMRKVQEGIFLGPIKKAKKFLPAFERAAEATGDHARLFARDRARDRVNTEREMALDDKFGTANPEKRHGPDLKAYKAHLSEIRAAIDAAVEKYFPASQRDLAKTMLYGIIANESTGNPDRKIEGGGKATGLGGITTIAAEAVKADHAEMGEVGPNIDATAKYLKLMMKRANQRPGLALYTYTTGLGTVRDYLKDKDPAMSRWGKVTNSRLDRAGVNAASIYEELVGGRRNFNDPVFEGDIDNVDEMYKKSAMGLKIRKRFGLAKEGDTLSTEKLDAAGLAALRKSDYQAAYALRVAALGPAFRRMAEGRVRVVTPETKRFTGGEVVPEAPPAADTAPSEPSDTATVKPEVSDSTVDVPPSSDQPDEVGIVSSDNEPDVQGTIDRMKQLLDAGATSDQIAEAFDFYNDDGVEYSIIHNKKREGIRAAGYMVRRTVDGQGVNEVQPNAIDYFESPPRTRYSAE